MCFRQIISQTCAFYLIGEKIISRFSFVENLFAHSHPMPHANYSEFGSRILSLGHCGEYCVCLCGPSALLQVCDELNSWDRRISFEELQDWFTQNISFDPIEPFMLPMIRQAISNASHAKPISKKRTHGISGEVEFDLFLTMVCATSSGFSAYLFEKAYKRPVLMDMIGVWRGSWNTMSSGRQGQRDVSILRTDQSLRKSLLLIENKFLDKFQPDQANKYREFGSDGLNEKWWEEYRTCLCGSSGFLQECEQVASWDTSLSFEEIRLWFGKNSFTEPVSSFVISTMTELTHDRA
jgi:hypothetical protein